jgi:hypothetical protein
LKFLGEVTKYSVKTIQNIMLMSTKYIREGVNVPMPDDYYLGNCSQAYYSSDLLLQGAHQAAPPSTSKAPLTPSNGPPAASETQYPRYLINSDLLQDMSKKLRKAGVDKVRKIPMREDMKIPKKIKKVLIK